MQTDSKVNTLCREVRPWTDSTVKTCNEDVGGESYEVVSSYLNAAYSERRIADQQLVVVEG